MSSSAPSSGARLRPKKQQPKEDEVLPLTRAVPRIARPGRQPAKVSKVAIFLGILVFCVVWNYFYRIHLRQSTTPGLWFPLSTPIAPVPSQVLEKTVCLSNGQTAMERAFRKRGWKIINVGSNSTILQDTHNCAKNGLASVIWTKKKHFGKMGVFKPWQRYSWIPHQNQMSMKSFMLINLLNRSRKVTHQPVSFVPETFILPRNNPTLILNRLREQGGMNEPWVIKLAATDNGIGIAMLGPKSPELQTLIQILELPNQEIPQVMTKIRDQLVFNQPNDQRSPEDVQRARDRSESLNDDIIFQRYVCNELTFKGHKFDLRLYYLIASVNPLVVLYHDGSLRVALGEYNSSDFSSTHDHLTNLGQNRAFKDASASFEDWKLELEKHVKTNAEWFAHSSIITKNPLQHIRNQIKSSLAELIASVRHNAFEGFAFSESQEWPMENGFSLMGADFIVDDRLNVYLTETQSSPGLSDSLPVKKALNNLLLPNKVAILEEVMDKQSRDQALLPLRNQGTFELIFTDDYQFTYTESRISPGPCI